MKCDGEVFVTNRLEDWCKDRKVPYSTLYTSSRRNGKIVTKGTVKGWKCELI